MNKRYLGWFFVGVSMTLVGPACVGDMTRAPDPVETSVAAPESVVSELGPVAVGATDSSPVDHDSDLDMSAPPSEQAIPDHGATGSYKTCSDMYFACQEIGGRCTRGYPGCDRFGQSSCGTCYEACQTGTAYPKACRCNSCGFTE
jgi:hypothetical protein